MRPGKNPWRAQAPKPPRAVERILADDMRRHTIRALLDRGAIETPIGARTVLRVGDAATGFPTLLVEEVKAERRASLLGAEHG